MAVVHSIRQLHSELADVCESLESLFRLGGCEHEELCSAARPAMSRFRDLLDAGDAIAGEEIRREVH